jgi:dephospho-CoA kinase
MKLIGLTGGIGSGKSTVADLFRLLRIPVYVSDETAKELMQKDDTLKKRIITLLGKEAYTPDGIPDRKYIASKVFNNKETLEALNAIVHPAVYVDLTKWLKEQENAGAPYCIQESAIVFEEDLSQRFDATILVVADEEIRIKRVMARDGVSREKVKQRMQNQWPDSQKLPFADYVIYNDNERSLIKQVRDIDEMIRAV